MPAVGQSDAPSPRYKTERPFRLWIAMAGMMGMLLLVNAPPPRDPGLSAPLEERFAQAALRGDLRDLRDIWAEQIAHPQFQSTRDALGYALCGAAISGSRAAVAQLLAWGADPNFRTPFGKTPLMCAAGCDHSDSVAPDLLQHGTDTTIRDRRGRTVWDLAVNCHDQALIAVLERFAPGSRLKFAKTTASKS